MKNKKGEIMTLLTLGLVVVGTIITLGTSFFVNNQRTNLASNSRASTTLSCPAGDVLSTGNTVSCFYACAPLPGVYSGYDAGAGHQQTVNGKYDCCCKPATATAPTAAPTQPSAGSAPTVPASGDNCGGTANSCCLQDSSCCLIKSSAGCTKNVQVYSPSLCQNGMPLSSCNGNSAYGGVLNLCSSIADYTGPGCYDTGSNGGSSGGAITSDPSYNPDLCKQKGYPSTSVYACCNSNGFVDCRESVCSINKLQACPGPTSAIIPPTQIPDGKLDGKCINSVSGYSCYIPFVCSSQDSSGVCQTTIPVGIPTACVPHNCSEAGINSQGVFYENQQIPGANRFMTNCALSDYNSLANIENVVCAVDTTPAVTTTPIPGGAVNCNPPDYGCSGTVNNGCSQACGAASILPSDGQCYRCMGIGCDPTHSGQNSEEASNMKVDSSQCNPGNENNAVNNIRAKVLLTNISQTNTLDISVTLDTGESVIGNFTISPQAFADGYIENCPVGGIVNLLVSHKINTEASYKIDTIKATCAELIPITFLN